WIWALLLIANSPASAGLLSGSCPSAHAFAPRFLQTSPRDDALALRSSFTSIRLDKRLSPSNCRTCTAHIDGRCKTLRVSHPPWKSLRDSHISTAPTTARLVQYKIKKGAFLSHTLRLPSGSFFNWKRLAALRAAAAAFSPHCKAPDGRLP